MALPKRNDFRLQLLAFQQVGNPSSTCHKFGSFEKLGFTEGAQKKCQQTNKTMKAFQQVYWESPQNISQNHSSTIQSSATKCHISANSTFRGVG